MNLSESVAQDRVEFEGVLIGIRVNLSERIAQDRVEFEGVWGYYTG